MTCIFFPTVKHGLSDSCIVRNNQITGEPTQKIYDFTGDGLYVTGWAGSQGASQRFLHVVAQIIGSGVQRMPEILNLSLDKCPIPKGTEGIIVDVKNDTLWHVDGLGWAKVTPPFAIGCGAREVMAAYRMQNDPTRAMAVCESLCSGVLPPYTQYMFTGEEVTIGQIEIDKIT